MGTYYDSTSLSGRKEFGSHTVVNLRAEAPVYSGQGYELLASVDLNNLTDEQYEMPWQFQDPGFNAFANLEVRF